LKSVVSLPGLDDERFSSQASRLEHNDELQAILTGWASTKTSDELHALALQGYPFTVARTPEALLGSEQWHARGVAQYVQHRDAGDVTVLAPPWLDERPPPRPAPALGEANAELLGAPAGVAR
jgi:formyl-CoA transferase